MSDPLWSATDPGLDETIEPTVEGSTDSRPTAATGARSIIGTADTTLAGDAPGSGVDRVDGSGWADAAGPLTSEQSGRYVLRGSLGVGGIGSVDRVFDRTLRRDVALKQLKPEVAARPDRLRIEARLAAEARITARLAHPGIVPVHELGRRPDGQLYYTMKRIEGRTLREALCDADLPERLALLPRYVALCQAVAHAHSRGYIHRDLKPANVMLGAFGETLVLDWGIARHLGAEAEPGPEPDPTITLDDVPDLGRTVEGAMLGTPQYMSPEQLTGRAADARSDVYALGVILFQLLTGDRPYTERSVAALVARVPRGPAPDAHRVEPRAPGELAAIARRALDPDPAARYPDAGALVDDVLAFQAGRLVAAHRYTPRQHAARWLRRNRVAVLVMAAVLVVAGATWIGRGQQEAERASRAEADRLESLLASVDAIIAEARRARAPGWLELYPSRLAGLKEPVVEDRLIALLDDDDRAVRHLAARTLGLMSSRRAVEPLAARLAEGAEADAAIVVEVIRALGIIGDPRAERAVYGARTRYGSTSYVAHNTELAYRMLPPDQPAADADADGWVDHGRALVEKQREAEAIAAYDRALALEPDLTRALNNRGIALRRLGRYAEAAADLDRALTVDPDFLPALFNRGSVRRHRMDYDGARDDYTRALARARALDRATLVHTGLRMRAWAAWCAGDLEGAHADLREALRLDGDNRQTLGVVGRFHQAAGRPADALAMLQRAVELDPKGALTAQHRARMHRELGNTAAAQADIDRARLLDPTLVDLAADRALIHLAAGERDEARAVLDDAIVGRPGDGALRAWRAALVHAEAGAWAAAADDLDVAVDLARPAEAVAFGLMRAASRRLAGRPPASIERRGELALHDALALWTEGRGPAPTGPTSEPRARCVVALAQWLVAPAARDGRPDGPPPFDPDPACTFVDHLPPGG